MTDYVWAPITGSGTPADPLVWHSDPFNWNTGSFWGNASELILGVPSIPTGTIPGSDTGNSQGPGLDNVGIVAGEISVSSLNTYNTVAPFLNDPSLGSNDYKVDLTINSGTVDLQDLLLASAFSASVSDIHEYPTVDVEGATLKLAGSIVNSYTVVFPVIGTQSASGGGTIDIGAGGTVAVAGSVQSTIVMNFVDGANNLLMLGGVSAIQPGAFAGTIEGFVAGDTIDLSAIPFSTGNTITFDSATDILAIQNGTTALASLPLSGAFTASQFGLQDDGAGNTAIVTCFVAGTRIRTTRGDVMVEALREGDLVPTRFARNAVPIKWIGRRQVDCTRHPRPELVRPVRITAGAFGKGMPERDLLVSPDHAVFVDGALIPVKYLIDGEMIAQVGLDAVIYYHVELPRHDVVLAEGLPVETYLDSGNRSAFENGGGATIAHPDFATRAWEAVGCTRLVVTGPELAAVKQRIRANGARFAVAA